MTMLWRWWDAVPSTSIPYSLTLYVVACDPMMLYPSMTVLLVVTLIPVRPGPTRMVLPDDGLGRGGLAPPAGPPPGIHRGKPPRRPRGAGAPVCPVRAAGRERRHVAVPVRSGSPDSIEAGRRAEDHADVPGSHRP